MNKKFLSLSLLMLTAASFAVVAEKGEPCKPHKPLIQLNCDGSGEVKHPLDPLTFDEITAVGEVVRTNIPEATEKFALFTSIDLVEPTKAAVKAFEKDGGKFNRRAQVILYNNKTAKTTEVIVDVCGTTAYIVDSRQLCGVFPNMNRINAAPGTVACLDETEEQYFTQGELEALLAGNAQVVKALKDAGYENPAQDILDEVLYPVFNTFESFRTSDKKSPCCPEVITADMPDHRYMPVTFADENIVEPYAGDFFSIVNGVEALVDLTTKKVVAVITTNNKDSRVTTAPNIQVPTYKHPMKLKPLITSMPEVSYTVENNVVKWDNWQFRLSWNSRSGLQLYNIKYFDSTVESDDKYRSILYKASISEAMVSYNSGSEILFARSYLSGDAFHYPWLRRFAPIHKAPDSATDIAGGDVPSYATLYDMFAADTKGHVSLLDDTIAIYEQDGDILWRTASPISTATLNQDVRGQRGRQLVVRSIFQGAYYTWIVSWIFNQDGTINVGIDVGGRTQNIIINKDAELPWGEVIADQELSLNHTHTYNFRLDFDVDGTENTLIEENQYTINDREINPCGQAVSVVEKELKTEQKAIRDLNLESNRQWIVLNPNKTNYMGHEVGYEIVPLRNGFSKSADYSQLHKQFSFIKHHIHATRFHDNEQFAAGEFPILQDHDTGLGQYVKDDECIENKDIVLWYTINFAHVPHTEDFPFISLYRQGFSIIPHNFFDGNPAYSPEDDPDGVFYVAEKQLEVPINCNSPKPQPTPPVE